SAFLVALARRVVIAILFPYTTLFRSGPTRQIHGVSDDFKPTLENAFSFFDDEDSQKISELFKTAILSGKSYDIETRLRRVSGERSEEHTSELQSRENLVCRLLLEKKI